MNDLNALRENIETLNIEILKLLSERGEIAKQIGQENVSKALQSMIPNAKNK